MFELITAFLVDNAVLLGAGAAVLSAIEIIFSPFRSITRPWRKPDKVELINPPAADTSGKLTTAEFLCIRREMRADLLAELATADPAEAVILRRRVDELERQIADPDPALAVAQAEIDRLKARLEREGNQIGAARLREAEAALEKLDFSIADAIFAEIEERQKLEVETAARAAYGRGEIAEAEIRWHDAANHFARAAKLNPTFDTLQKAHEYAWRAGNYPAAFGFGAELLEWAKAKGTQEQLATALNEHALTLQAQGQYPQAEALCRQALEIGRATIGEAHPNYATRLNNLAIVVRAQGRLAEAEGLFRQALEIDRATIGEAHPDYAIRLNNLAGVVEDQGRLAEAEGLFRQALEIGRATIGEAHPDYATRLNNLGGVLFKQGKMDAAREHLLAALAIRRARLGDGHPDTQQSIRNVLIVLTTHFPDDPQIADLQALLVPRP